MSVASEEALLASKARYHAEELFSIASELRWGDGTAAGCAWGFLTAAAGTRQYRLGADLTVSVRFIFDRDNWTCQECGTHRNLTVDHIVARANGGSDDPSNLRTLCMTCNSSKGARQ